MDGTRNFSRVIVAGGVDVGQSSARGNAAAALCLERARRCRIADQPKQVWTSSGRPGLPPSPIIAAAMKSKLGTVVTSYAPVGHTATVLKGLDQVTRCGWALHWCGRDDRGTVCSGLMRCTGIRSCATPFRKRLPKRASPPEAFASNCQSAVRPDGARSRGKTARPTETGCPSNGRPAGAIHGTDRHPLHHRLQSVTEHRGVCRRFGRHQAGWNRRLRLLRDGSPVRNSHGWRVWRTRVDLSERGRRIHDLWTGARAQLGGRRARPQPSGLLQLPCFVRVRRRDLSRCGVALASGSPRWRRRSWHSSPASRCSKSRWVPS